jgi:predicted acetyltransferase
MDKDAVKKLWHTCFNDGDPFLSWYFDNVFNENNTLFYNGSCMQYIEYEMVVRKKRTAAPYILGVMTEPSMRNKGQISHLFKDMFALLYKRGYEACTLIPFNFDFYRRYGFECVSEHEEYRGGCEDFAKFNPSPAAAGVSEGFDYTELSRIYTRFAESLDGYIVRDEAITRHLLEIMQREGVRCFYRKDLGYLLFEMAPDRIDIIEFCALSAQAAEGLLAAVYRLGASKPWSIRALPGSLDGVLGISGVIKPHAMGRIINARKAVNGLEGDFELRLSDEFILQNNGAFIAGDGGKRYVMDIKTFSALYFGALTPTKAQAAGQLSGDVRPLEKAFKKRVNYFNLLGWV